MKQIYQVILIFLFLFSNNFLFAKISDDKLNLGVDVSLFGASSKLSSFLPQDYKVSVGYFKLPINYYFDSGLSVVATPFFLWHYEDGGRPQEDSKFNFSKLFLLYKYNNFDFKLGRFDYVTKQESFVIYYGEELDNDLSFPTALDGFLHQFDSEIFSYKILLSKEVSAMSDTNTDPYIFGGTFTFNPFPFIDIQPFYYYKKWTEGNIKNKLSVYGGGLNIYLSEVSSLSFYAAQNGGSSTKSFKHFSLEEDYRGYAYLGTFNFRKETDILEYQNVIGFYVFSEGEEGTLPYTALSKRLTQGIVYDDMNFDEIVGTFPKTIFTTFDLQFSHLDNLDLGVDLFLFSAPKDKPDNTSQEIDFRASFSDNIWAFSLGFGLLKTDIPLYLNTYQSKTIKKLQAKLSIKFDL